MDPTQSGNNWQTLASVLAGGLAGYVDAQNNQPVTAVQPLPQTAYGYQGTAQATPTSAAFGLGGGHSTLLLLGVVAVVAIIALKNL
jgi:hypothetical protein